MRIKKMRTEKEIKDSITNTKIERARLSGTDLESGNYLQGWLNALEWVLRTSSIKVDVEDEV